MPMPKLSKLSVETLLQLRADVEKMLATKANQLKSQFWRDWASRLRQSGGGGFGMRERDARAR